MNSDTPDFEPRKQRDPKKASHEPSRSGPSPASSDPDADFQLQPKREDPRRSSTVTSGRSTPRRSNAGPGSGGNTILKAGIVGLVALGAFLWFSSPRQVDEKSAPGWSQVEGLDTSKPVRWVNRAGAAQIVTAISLTSGELDQKLTQSVQQQLQSGNQQAANDLVAQAQQIPPLPPQAREPDGQPIKEIKPTLTQGMADGVLRGDTKFFHLFLFDSCAEDGDVVEVQINGQAFATVPIWHRGATLSIPVSAGSRTEVSLRGIYDGGGGITVACRTSEGDFFMRAMHPGEIQNVAVVQK